MGIFVNMHTHLKKKNLLNEYAYFLHTHFILFSYSLVLLCCLMWMKYVILAPWVIHAIYSFLVKDEKERCCSLSNIPIYVMEDAPQLALDFTFLPSNRRRQQRDC